MRTILNTEAIPQNIAKNATSRIMRTLLLVSLLSPLFGRSQVGIGTTTPNASAKLEVQSETQGFLPPRMTATQRANIAAPVAGLMVYQTDGTTGLYIHNGTAWIYVINSNDGTLPVASGGTGATSAANAIANLGVIASAEKGAINGVATLGSNGKIPSAQIPAVSFQSANVVATEAAMLALSSAVAGSIAIRTDNNKNYVLSATPPSTLSNWIELATPTSVTSVNGNSGPSVTLTPTHLGATTIGDNLFTLANPGAISFPRFNANNTVSALSASDFRTAIGAGTSSTSGTVTSVGLSLPDVLTVSGSPVTSSGTLSASLANQNANRVFAGPASGSAAAPTFRSLVAADIPTLNQNTTGTASNVTGTVAVANGGTGTTTGSITGSGSLTFTAGGTNQDITLAPSGTGKIVLNNNVGIGTSTPTSRLNLVGGGIKIHNGFSNSATRPALTGESIGNYEIRGVGSITGTTQIDGGDDGFLRLSAGGGTNPTLTQSSIDISGISPTNADMDRNIVMRTAGVERLRIVSTGLVGIGTATPSYRLDVQGGDINASGSVRAGGVVLTSDARLKDVIQSWDNDDQIDLIQFRWKNNADDREHYGYLAQEVQKVLPDAVHTDSKGTMSVNYDEVQSYKIAMQEHRIKDLEQMVGQKQIKIEYLEKMIDIAKEELNIDIKKNSNTPPSNGSVKTKGN